MTFEVTNKGTKVTEFYLYAEGDRILGEVENIGPGLTRRLIVEVTEAGRLQTACKPGMKGDGIRGEFTVSGDGKKSTDTNAKLAEATKSYQRYVNSQLETHRAGDGFKLYTELTEDEVKALAAAVDALGEPISKVAEVVSQ